MAGQFAEHERNQQHAPDREPERPDVAGPAMPSPIVNSEKTPTIGDR